ncbi:hypothetical protein MJO52_05370 [Microbulbifer variabilis]|uniref:SMODS-associated and fused to various effectors domain-containing protein n=1 Tax=Microbulbifer variabilis TaxID=266805 RepID=A0ABY4VE28_9GAMM|nr:hypothetical protein [Microbulbifer variabilis]USD22563.1 hypothetical protein MJO52_05370 [Microbulbifer variabilis]
MKNRVRSMLSILKKNNEQKEGDKNPTTDNIADHPIPLKDYYLFRWTLCVGFGFALIVAAFIWWSNLGLYEGCGSSLCWKTFFDIYSPSIKVATGTLALAGLIGLVYRSTQTAEQIAHANRMWGHELTQSAFSRHIEHRQMFINVLNDLEKRLGIKFSDKSELYEIWFPESKIHSFNISLNERGAGPLAAANKLESVARTTFHHYANGIFTIKSLKSQNKLIHNALEDIGIAKNSNGIFDTPGGVNESTENTVRIIYTILKSVFAITSSKEQTPKAQPIMLEIYPKAGKKLFYAETARTIKPKDNLVCIFGNITPDQQYNIDPDKPNIEIHHVSEEEIKGDPTIELRKILEINKEGLRDNTIRAENSPA